MAVNPVTLAGWMLDAGWAGSDAITATAVALRSGADPAPPRGIFGLGSAGDGAAQARAGYALWAGRNRDWNVFPGHRDAGWQLFIPGATAAVAAAATADVAGAVGGEVKNTASTVTGAVTGTVTTAGNAIESAGQIAGFLVSDKAWERIVKIGIGGGLVLLAVAALGKRLTFDQGTRFLRGVSDYAGLIFAARGAGARMPGSGRPAARPSGGPRSSAPYTAKHRPKPDVRRVDPQWNKHETEPRPIVRYKGTAKAPPRPLPGEATKPRTQREKREAK